MENNCISKRSFFIENNISFDEVKEDVLSVPDSFCKELEYCFDCWFSNLLTETVQLKDKSFITIQRDIEDVCKDISNEEIELMGYNCGWFDEFVEELKTGTVDKRNAIFIYAIHCLYLYNDNVCYEDRCWLEGMEFNYDALYIFLNSLTPFESVKP